MSLLDRFRDRAGSGSAATGDPLVDELRAALSPDRVKTDGAQRSLLGKDASVFDGGSAGPICYPESTDEVVEIMRVAQQHDRAVVPRGAGTGLAGGAIPLGAPIVVAVTKMRAILEIDEVNGIAWVEPGVINLDLTRHLTPLGYHFAPDPSSQQVCTIGGNVANNSGGPHCLAYGVTNSHVAAIEVVTPAGEVVMLGGLDPEPDGYDLRGVFIGSEGTLGIATKVAVRLTKNRPAVRPLLLSFASVRDAANTVSGVIADATMVRLATDENERALLWKGRKTAFGAVAQIAPDYYLHDTVVPRSALADVLDEIYVIADRHELLIMNVFHAGDGNLHPLIVFDGREAGVLDRVHAAGGEIIEASLAAGGVLSGEHGIGVEKQKYMDRLFSEADLDHQNRLRRAFDPICRANPGKVLPMGHSCADIQQLRSVPTGVWG